MAAPSPDATTGPAKLDAVTKLVGKLTEDLQIVTLLPDGLSWSPNNLGATPALTAHLERNQALEKLKIYSRDPDYADPIFTQEGVSMILRHVFYSPSSETARAALRVLANVMLLKPETRQIFVDQGFAARACNELRVENWDNEFLISRILFLSTYETNVDLENLIENQRLADHLVHNISRHAKLLSCKAKARADSNENVALGETLKLMFNVTHFCKEKVFRFTPAIPNIVALFWKQDFDTVKPLNCPFGQLVNSLLNLDLQSEKALSALFPRAEPTRVCARLVALLDQSMKAYGDSDLEAIVTPLISLIGKLYESASQPNRQHLEEALLPSAEDRKAVLGRGNTLSARLLKNSTNPLTPALRNAISYLFFDISGKNASKFVENVGYGFASGFLFQNNMPIPASASEAFSTRDTSGVQKPVNPMTGQFLDQEQPSHESSLTQEEKEREAERLFVLFERLKKSGIVNVQNPVGMAVQEGKFQELDDDGDKTKT